MYKIGEFSKLVGISISTLRHYEKIGLLIPKRTDPTNNYCYYDGNNYLNAVFISGLKEIGFTLKEIKHCVDLQKDDELYNALVKKKEALGNEQQRINNLLNEINEYLLMYGGIKDEMG